MASEKKRRKRDSVARRLDGQRPAASRDGDRRLREAMASAREVVRRKQTLREWTIDDGPPPDALPPDGPG